MAMSVAPQWRHVACAPITSEGCNGPLPDFCRAVSGGRAICRRFPAGRLTAITVQKEKRRNFRPYAAANADNEESSGSASMEDECSLGTESLHSFFDLNSGRWAGSFSTFNSEGQVLHCVPIEVSASTHGKGPDATLKQLLRVQQAGGHSGGKEATEENSLDFVWKEVQLDETNRFTVDRRQQLGYFEKYDAFAVSHLTAEVLDCVLRTGVLDGDGEEEPDTSRVKLPSQRPALVSECCLYAEDRSRRIRAFHVLDPRGVIDTIGVFHEERKEEAGLSSHGGRASEGESDGERERLEALLGEWEGNVLTQRSGLYGSTTVEQPSRVAYRQEEDGTVVQELDIVIAGKVRTLTSRATVNGALLSFKGGLQMTLLPGGLSLSCPAVVARGQAFYLEAAWMEAEDPPRRKRLVRTFDTEGMVVSTTLYTETKRTSGD